MAEMQTYPDAYIALGQTSFTNRVQNANGASAYKYNTPTDVFVSTWLGKTFVVDQLDSRVLVYNSTNPITNQMAAIALGQPNLAGNTCNFDGIISSGSLCSPSGVVAYGTKVIVADTGNHRVLIWNNIPTVTDAQADVVLGQPDMVTNSPNQGPFGMYNPESVAVYKGKLLVADTYNHRVSIYNTIPTVSYTLPDLVLGQKFVSPQSKAEGSFTAYNYSANNSYKNAQNDSFRGPADVFISTVAGKTFVVDAYNNRVLIYNSTSPVLYQQADLVLGQQNFSDNECNTNIGNGATGNTMCYPASVWSDGTRLVVADSANHRVLIWNNLPTVNGQTADLVVGQLALTDITNASTAQKLYRPMDAWYDASVDQFFVVDFYNHRVQVFNGFPTANNATADFSIGQNQTNSSAGANQGLVPGANTLYYPRAGTSGDGKLFLTEWGNHRVLAYNLPITQNAQPANYVLGQLYFSSNTVNAGSSVVISTGMSAPTTIYYSSGTLFVGDTQNNNRVLVWTSPITVNSQAPNYVLGQTAFNTTAGNQGGISASTLYGGNDWQSGIGIWASSTTLAVSDLNNNRILYYKLPITQNAKPASAVLGQPGFVTNDANRGGITASSLYYPWGVNVDQVTGKVYVADSYNHRVLVWNSMPTVSGQAADFVIGQSSFNWVPGTQVWNWNGISPTSLKYPYNVAAYNDNVYVSDNNNNRILVWTSPITALGQGEIGRAHV